MQLSQSLKSARAAAAVLFRPGCGTTGGSKFICTASAFRQKEILKSGDGLVGDRISESLAQRQICPAGPSCSRSTGWWTPMETSTRPDGSFRAE